MNLRKLTSGIMLTFCLHLMPAAEVELTPGSLSSWLDANSLEGETELVLSGSCDVRDFRAMRRIPSSVRVLRMEALRIESYTYPSVTPGRRAYFPADELPEWSLFDSGLADVTLPSGLVAIGDGALASTAITSLVIPDGVVRIGDYALYDNSGLVKVSLPSSLTTLGKGAVAKCVSLTDLDFTATGLTSVGDRCFAGDTGLTAVEFPATLRRVGREVFTSTAVCRLRLGSVTEFGDYALSGMPRLEEATLNARATMGRGVFMADGSLNRVTGAIDSLPPLFAAGCSSLNPSDVAASASFIDNWALASTAGESIILSGSLSSVGDGALSDITALRLVDARNLEGNVPNATEGSFGDADLSVIKLYVADFTEDLWKSHPVWGRFNIVSDRLSDIETPSIADTDSDIRIVSDAGTLSVISPTAIDSVILYSSDGSVVASASPCQREFSMKIPDVAGVVIVVVKTGDIVKTVKITSSH